MDAPGLAAAGKSPLVVGMGIEHHLDARLRVVEEIVDGFHDKTSKALHMTEECFNGELNGDCGGCLLFCNPIQCPQPPSSGRVI